MLLAAAASWTVRAALHLEHVLVELRLLFKLVQVLNLLFNRSDDQYADLVVLEVDLLDCEVVKAAEAQDLICRLVRRTRSNDRVHGFFLSDRLRIDQLSDQTGAEFETKLVLRQA